MPRWLEEEDNIFRELYGKVKIEEIIRLLPRHSPSSIRKRSSDLKIKGNMSLAKRKYYFDTRFFSEIEPRSCYWAGFIAADGNISKGNSLRIALARKDREHLQKFVNECKFTGPLKDYQNKSNPTRKSILGSRIDIWGADQWISDLKRIFNIIPRKTLVLEPPFISDPFNLYYIIGYFDGDGCRYQKGSKFDISFCGTEKLLVWTKSILDLLLDNVTEAKRILKRKNVQCYRLNYSGNPGRKIHQALKELNCPWRLSRKWD